MRLMEKAPPDLPAGSVPPNFQPRRPFAKRAARWSLWTALVGLACFLIPLALVSAIEPSADPTNRAASGIRLFSFQAVAILPSLIWLSGIVLGALALRGVRTAGRRGILWPSFAAILLNCSFLLMIIARLDSLKIDWDSLEKDRQIVQANDKDWSEVQKADHIFAIRAHAILTNYQTAGDLLADPPVLDMTLVKTREDLHARQGLVRQFLKASQDSLDFTTNDVELYRQELLKHDISQQARARALRHFTLAIQSDQSAMVSFRKADLRRGQLLLQILTMLEDQWGKWEYKPETKRFDFQTDDLLAQFRLVQKQLNDVTGEELKLHQRAEDTQNTNR